MPRAFVPNPGFKKQLEGEGGYQSGLAKAAEPAAQAARALSHSIMPKGPGITVVKSGLQVVVANTDYGGHIAEYGSRNSPAYAPLRRGVRAAGFRLTEIGK